MPNCRSCGAYAGEERWRTLCARCFREHKKLEEAAREERLGALEEEVLDLRAQLRIRPKPLGAFAEIPKERLRQLLQLCHPDKHGSSKTANEVTAWLLEMKGKR